MEHFKEIFQKIISTIMINPSDSEIDKAKKIIWYSFFGSIIILLVISWIIFAALTFSTNIVKTPMIDGDNVYKAINKLYEKRLVSNVNPKYSEKIDAGVVYNQSPKPGSIVKKGRIISFFVSLGPREIALPDFRGFTLFELDNYLNTKYPDGNIPFNIENPVYEFNEEVEKGRIIKQEPKDGIPVYNVNKINLWISNGIKEDGAIQLGNYIGKKIQDVSKKLSDLEIFYSYEFVPIRSRSKDMIIVDQSISEGMLVDEIIEESKVLVLKVNQYNYIKGEKIKGTYLLDIPKKPIPYTLEVKLKNGSSKEKSILKEETKGGVSLPIPYTGKKDAKLFVYYDGELQNEIELLIEENE